MNLQDTLKTIIHSPGASHSQGEGGSKDGPSRGSTAIDSLQLMLDAIGIADPTPISDGINAAISVGRMFTDPERRGEHAQNAAISAVSMVPYIGDTAKLLKAKRAGKTVKRAAAMADEGLSGVSAAAKRKSRQEYREQAEAALGGIGGGGSGSSGGGNGSGGVTGGGGDRSGSGGGARKRRSNEKGIEEHDRWSEKLSSSTEKILAFTGKIGKAGVQAVAFVQGLNLLNSGVLALNRDLAGYNGNIQGAYAKYDADEIQRDMTKGNALAGPLTKLAEEQSELKDNIAAFRNPLEAMGTQVLVQITKLTNGMLAVVQSIPGVEAALTAIEDALNDDVADNVTDFRAFFEDVSDGKFDGMRPTFDGKSERILNDKDHKQVFGK